MRMWMISPSLLCRQHLLGEHNEIHKHRPSFVKHYSMTGRIGQIEPLNMAIRHDELAQEMIARGYKHNSPYELPDLSYLSQRERESKVNVEESISILTNRCKQCRKMLKTRYVLTTRLKVCLGVLVILTNCFLRVSEANEPIKWSVEQIANAIYKAEGGNKTKYPYGILKKYKHTTPRQACINTIKHAKADWNGQGDFIVFLGNRYCPVGASNDNGSNKWWVKNVKYFLHSKV